MRLQFYHKLPLLIRVHTKLLASMCHAMPFWTRALKKKRFSLTFIPGKNKSKCGFVVCILIDNGYASLFFSQKMFPHCFCMLSEFCKSFWKESWRVQVVICIMQRVHFQVAVGVFNCQQILTKISFVIFKNWVMLSVRISSYGCTREVWRARKKRKSCSRRSREQL